MASLSLFVYVLVLAHSSDSVIAVQLQGLHSSSKETDFQSSSGTSHARMQNQPVIIDESGVVTKASNTDGTSLRGHDTTVSADGVVHMPAIETEIKTRIVRSERGKELMTRDFVSMERFDRNEAVPGDKKSGQPGLALLRETHMPMEGAPAMLLSASTMGLQRIRYRNHSKDPAAGTYVPGSDGTYSQNYQDKWISALAHHNGWDKSGGFFFDLGAFDGLKCSNTALVEKQFGWRGICVEPSPLPRAFEKRTCLLVTRALSDMSGKDVKFYGRPGTQLEHIGKQSIDRSDDEGRVIQTLSISDLLDCANHTLSSTLGDEKCKGVPERIQIPNFINVISLDVEGQSTAVLSTFPFDRVKVGAWVIEKDFKGEENNRQKHALLAKNGYKLVHVDNAGVDEYFVRPEFWDESLGKKDWRVHPEGSDGC